MYGDREFSDGFGFEDTDKQAAALGADWDFEDEDTLDLDAVLAPFSARN